MAISKLEVGVVPLGVGGDSLRSAAAKINANFADSTHAASRLVGTNAGNVVEYTAHGIGGTGLGNNALIPMLDSNDVDDPRTLRNGVYSVDSTYYDGIHGSKLPFAGHSVFFNYAVGNGAQAVQMVMRRLSNKNTPEFYYRAFDTLAPGVWTKVYTDRNTTIINGNLKPSSPVVKIHTDSLELNEDAVNMGVTLNKRGVGDYLIQNTTGLRSDGGWSIELPQDVNGNPYFAVAYNELENNDIEVKTYKRTFDMNTFMFAPDLESPIDIKEGSSIAIRFNDLPDDDDEPVL